ncbi:MAG TPA: phosphate ABC transporter permease PstA [Gammaproteobacteria bacterium]|nr:phosphate ABC transporter permease PstA [Gammaproteobacteria bacterium]
MIDNILTGKLSAKPSVLLLKRRWMSRFWWFVTGLSLFILGFSLLYLLGFVFFHGAGALTLKTFTEDTQGIAGGLRNAIVGSLLISGLALAMAIPVGVSAGIYLAEYDYGRLVGRVARFMSDVLVGVPSIILGYFGYITMVVYLGWKFSLLAASITLAIMMLPYIARTTEMALREVPHTVRESAYALGAGEGRVMLRIMLPAGRTGILTGILLSLSISLGETAPLIYTANWSNYMWEGHFTNEPVSYLTYVIWSYIGEPYTSAHKLAYAAAFLIVFMVLGINVVARYVLRNKSGHHH